MGKLKDAAITAKSKAGTTSRAPPVGSRDPDRFVYALAAYSAERRQDGWYIAKTVATFTGEKPKWIGPFETIETACLSIARHLAVEIADRHTRSIEAHHIGAGDPLYGLKKTTRLRQAPQRDDTVS